MSQNANIIIDRLKLRLGLTTDNELCKMLDIKYNTLSTWKKRDTLNFNKVMELCSAHNIPLDYAFFGIEEVEKEAKKGVEDTRYFHSGTSAEVIKELKLVNTNRNLILLKVNESCNPSILSGSVVVGQKIGKKHIGENILYIIQLMSKKYIVDELRCIHLKKKQYEFKHCKDDHSLIVSDENILKAWQVLDIFNVSEMQPSELKLV